MDEPNIPQIRVENLTKVYTTGDVVVRALAGVSLAVEKGEFLAIMGSSGSGKSTLMNILGCLDKPTSGEYWLAGLEVSRLDKNALAEVRNRTLGFVFQSFNLLSRTSALENVELPLLYQGVGSRDRKARATRALERVGLGKRLDHVPNQLSGGQQQRVAIARALVGEPKVILADEPTGNLDSRTSLEVMALFQELGETGITKSFANASAAFTAGWKWWAALALLALIYFYAHYGFASITAHSLAMYTPFLLVVLGAGAPAALAVALLAYFSNLSAGLTHYGTTPGPIYFGAGYVSQRKWWQLGLIATVPNILIWTVIGLAWWKILGWW